MHIHTLYGHHYNVALDSVAHISDRISTLRTLVIRFGVTGYQ